jgi:hypothetical protein
MSANTEERAGSGQTEELVRRQVGAGGENQEDNEENFSHVFYGRENNQQDAILPPVLRRLVMQDFADRGINRPGNHFLSKTDACL